MPVDDADADAFGQTLLTLINAGAGRGVLGRFALLYRNQRSIAGHPASIMEMHPVLEFQPAVAAPVAETEAHTQALANRLASEAPSGGNRSRHVDDLNARLNLLVPGAQPAAGRAPH